MSRLILRLMSKLRDRDIELGLYNYHVTIALQLPSFSDMSPFKRIVIFIDSLVKNLLI